MEGAVSYLPTPGGREARLAGGCGACRVGACHKQS